ncbi:MAG TPA: hypothetical protein GXZ61_00595 [Clostridiales bacterium]|jgi:alpha-tubulin suppressor-like RCC1 family protein|nr:hypothetical protein [Clostridiales bacterium]
MKRTSKTLALALVLLITAALILPSAIAVDEPNFYSGRMGDIAIGLDHCFALQTNGRLWAWGITALVN